MRGGFYEYFSFHKINITEQGIYFKRKNSHFSFSNNTERKRSASYRNEMEMLHIVELWRNNASSSGFYEARLCRMKRHVVL